VKKQLLTYLNILLISALLISFGGAPAGLAAPAQPDTDATERVSVASDGTQGNERSSPSSISADGRYVAFSSLASNLVSGESNWSSDIFVHDRQSGQTTRVSVASNGTQGNSGSYDPSISADGRYVAFTSFASNLVSGDTNDTGDIFVHDRQSGQTTRVSVASNGTQANDESGRASISADGRYVAFWSAASNLVSGDTNGAWDIFVRDRQSSQTTRVSVASNGTQGNSTSARASISADGRYVAFWSYASNLVSGDTNGAWDIFVRDRQSSQTARVSVASDGTQGNSGSGYPSISADGRYVAFSSSASNLVSGDTNGCGDTFVHDRQSSQTTRVSVDSNGTQGNGSPDYAPSISADGRFVAFSSYAKNLVSGDTNFYLDVFVRDRQSSQTTRVSVASDGTQGNANSYEPFISADGRYVAFCSDASNLVSGDTNGYVDVFVHDRVLGQPKIYLPLIIK
jgi:Tol biopolymer transport system component